MSALQVGGNEITPWPAQSPTADSGTITADSTYTGDLSPQLVLDLLEVNRTAGTVLLRWNDIRASSYTIQDNQADLLTNQVSPVTISNLAVGTSHRFRVVAIMPGQPPVASREIAFEYGTNESMNVTAYPWGNAPQQGYVLKYQIGQQV